MVSKRHRSLDYKKMHMISHAMYEKLLRCLAKEGQDAPFDDPSSGRHQSYQGDQSQLHDMTMTDIPPSTPFQSEYINPSQSHDMTDQPSSSIPFQSEYVNPVPGPSDINPETGEYYEMPDVTPPDFKWQDSTIQHTGDVDPGTPEISMFESFHDGDRIIPPKRGRKTYDPTKIKRSGKIVKMTSRTIKPFKQPRSRSDLITNRQPLDTIYEADENIPQHLHIPRQPARAITYHPQPESHDIRQRAITYHPQPPQPESHDTSQFIEQPFMQNIPDFSFSSEHRPQRTSTPKPLLNVSQQSILNRTQRPDVSSNVSLQQPPHQLIPVQNQSGVHTRRQIRQIPLASCKPKVQVAMTGDESIRDLPAMGKFLCNICNKYFSTKYSLKKHTNTMHTDKPSEPTTSVTTTTQPETTTSSTSFPTWVELGKRTASTARLVNPTLKRIQQEDDPRRQKTSKKTFKSWK
jgi:hypothetical protein